MRRNRRKNMYLFLFIIVCSLGIGYAFLRTELTINGTADFLDARWDIHFNNVVINPNSVELSTGNTAATISPSTTEVTYAVTLKEPGDFYEFTVDAVNSGSMDAMIDTISSKMGGVEITTLPAYMEYFVTYSDGVALAPKQYLKAGSTETYKVHIGFKKDISASDLTGQVENKTLSFSVTYVQADNTATEVEHLLNGIVYTVNKYDYGATDPKWNAVWINQAIHETIPYFETPAEALSAIATASSKDLPFYLKHKVVNGIVTEQYVEFVVTETLAGTNAGMVPGTYTLRAERTYDDDTSTWLVDENYISPYYEANKEVIKTAFGYATNANRCSESGTGRSSRFSCSVSGLYADARANGSVSANDKASSYCLVGNDSDAGCTW